MKSYQKLPACKAALSLITGICLVDKLPLLVAGLCWILGSLIFIFYKRDKKITKIIIIFMLVGMLLTIKVEYEYNNLYPETVWQENTVKITGEIKEDLKALTGHKLYLKPIYISNKKVNKGLIQLDCRYLPWCPEEGTLVKGEFNLKRGEDAKNPGGFSYRNYLRNNQIMGLGYLQGNLIQVGKNKFSFKNYIITFKKYLINLIDQCVKSPYNEIYKALLLGERAQISSEWENNFKLAGASHLLAISGLHVGFIILILVKLLKCISLPLLLRDLLITFLIVIYIFLTGGRASVVRAGLLSIFCLWAPLLNKNVEVYNILGITALLLLIINPFYIYDIGFQLTYLIILIILIWHNIISKWTGNLLGVALSAQLGSIPIISYYFNIITPIGIITNIWAIPLIGVIILILFPALFLGLLIPKLFVITSIFVNFLLKLLKTGMEITSRVPFAQVEVPTPSLPIIIITYICLLVTPILFKKRIIPINKSKNIKHRKILSCFIIIFLTYIIFQTYVFIDPNLKTTFFAVGQGDAVLFELPYGQNILIDGGGISGFKSDKGKDVILPYLRKKGIKTIDLAIITHFDTDHALGILGLLENNKIKSILIPESFDNNKLTQKIINTANKNKINISMVKRGQCLTIKDIEFKILHPSSKIKYNNINRNNNSIVLKVIYNNFSLLLTGDLEIDGEKYLINCGDNLKSNILKIGHHGSSSSSSRAFLKAVNPNEAIISVGNNNYGHPDERVINRLNKLKIRKWITRDRGAIIIESDGLSYNIKGYVPKN